MDEEDMDQTMIVLESAVEALCLDTEFRPSKRLRTGEAKTLQYSMPNSRTEQIQQAISSNLPPHLTWSEWSSLVPGTVGVAAKDLVEKLGITPQNLKAYEPLIKLNLEEGNGRFYMKGSAPRTSRKATPLTTDKIKVLIPLGGLWVSEWLQNSAIKNDDLPALMIAVRQVAVLKNARIYLPHDPTIDFEQEVDDSEPFYTNVIYDSGNLSATQLKLEHENMQQCIDQLRETIRDERKARAGLYKRFERYRLEQYAESLERSVRYDEIAMATSEDEEGDQGDTGAVDDEPTGVHNAKYGESDQSHQGQHEEDAAEERGADCVDNNDEIDAVNDEDNGIEDEETTIFVNADLASTLTKLRRGMVPFLNPDFVDAIREAEKRGKEIVQALLLEGDRSDDGIPLNDMSSDESKRMYAEWYARNATHSENDAGGVEIYVYT